MRRAHTGGDGGSGRLLGGVSMCGINGVMDGVTYYRAICSCAWRDGGSTAMYPARTPRD